MLFCFKRKCIVLRLVCVGILVENMDLYVVLNYNCVIYMVILKVSVISGIF